MVLDAAPRDLEQLPDEPWRRDDRRAGVEHEPVLLEHVGSSTGLVELLDNRDLMSLRLEPDRRGKPAEAAADHHDVHCLRVSRARLPCRELRLEAPRLVWRRGARRASRV